MDQNDHAPPSAAGGTATAVDYRTLSTPELKEIRFSKLDDWLDESHATGEARTNIVAFVDAIAYRAGFDWATDTDVDDVPT